MSEQIRESFYQSRLQDFTISNYSLKEDNEENKRLKEIAKNPIPQEIINNSLKDIGKTAEGFHYNFLSFVAI